MTVPVQEESRFYRKVEERVNPANKQRVRVMECPFCGSTVEAYLWSLAGSGKKCECGAVFLWRPQVCVRRRSGV